MKRQFKNLLYWLFGNFVLRLDELMDNLFFYINPTAQSKIFNAIETKISPFFDDVWNALYANTDAERMAAVFLEHGREYWHYNERQQQIIDELCYLMIYNSPAININALKEQK